MGRSYRTALMAVTITVLFWVIVFMGYSISMGNETIVKKDETIQKEIFHIDELNRQIATLEKEMEEFKENAECILALSPLAGLVSDDEIESLVKKIPKGNPFSGPFQITASFGESTGLVPRESHFGIDLIPKIPEEMEWNIYSFWEGTVVSYGLDQIHGKNVVVEHFPWLRTKYSHLSKIYYSGTTGKKVMTKTKIGVMGDTGMADGAHLHFEIQIRVNENRWIQIDPKPFLRRD